MFGGNGDEPRILNYHSTTNAPILSICPEVATVLSFARMGNPVILAVDDDPLVLAAVQRDLREKYASDYQVARSVLGAAGTRDSERIDARRATRRRCWSSISACRR